MAWNPYVALLPVVIFALRLTGQGMCSHIAIVSMARWFVATRGRALSIASLGFAAGEALLPLIFVALLGVFHWRSLWVVAALIAIAGIPLLMMLLRTERTPQSMADENQSVGMQGLHWTRASALRHPLFWFMVPALLGPAAFNTAFFFHQVYFADLKGWTHLSLVTLFPLYTSVAIAAMVASGIALDRFGDRAVDPPLSAADGDRVYGIRLFRVIGPCSDRICVSGADDRGQFDTAQCVLGRSFTAHDLSDRSKRWRLPSWFWDQPLGRGSRVF